jgi:hypothetical protein
MPSLRPGEDFGCPHCQVKYSIRRRQTPPGFNPSCEDCDQQFSSREHADWLVYDRADAAHPSPAPRPNPSKVIYNSDRSGPSVYPRSGGSIAALRAFMDRFVPAVTFRARVACREYDRWREISFAERVSKFLRKFGFSDGRRASGMVVQTLINGLLLYLATAKRFLSVTHQTYLGANGAECRLRTRRSLQPSIPSIDIVPASFEYSDDDITKWPGSRLLPMR